MTMRFIGLLTLASAFLTVASSAAIAADPTANAAVTPAATTVEPYAPGLGDFMTAYIQPHHIKLWFACNAGNWKLAAYEANELSETFEDIKTYQGMWKMSPWHVGGVG
jgi:hypothetical protein